MSNLPCKIAKNATFTRPAAFDSAFRVEPSEPAAPAVRLPVWFWPFLAFAVAVCVVCAVL